MIETNLFAKYSKIRFTPACGIIFLQNRLEKKLAIFYYITYETYFLHFFFPFLFLFEISHNSKEEKKKIALFYENRSRSLTRYVNSLQRIFFIFEDEHLGNIRIFFLGFSPVSNFAKKWWLSCNSLCAFKKRL